MNALPLIAHENLSRPVAWHPSGPISAARYLREVRDMAGRLPPARYVLNLCDDRYRFMVVFGAALVNGQTCVLPPNHAQRVLGQVRAACVDHVCVVDHAEAGHADAHAYPDDLGVRSNDDAVPLIAPDHVAALVFTSGSTGDPRPNAKAWGRLVAGAHSEREALGLDAAQRYAYVGTVPPQHMYGFESTVLLPMQTGGAVHASRPLFARDVATCLAQVPAPRVLITTPIHIRALLEEGPSLPPLARAVSAAAPLAREPAEDFERRYGCELREIYGFTEAGMLATRRTSTEDAWRLMPGIRLERDGDGWCALGGHVNGRPPFSDVIEMQGEAGFSLVGRAQDMVNIAGKRASLGDLNHHLNRIPGVRDGVFHLPRGDGRRVQRLMAFVVAPGMSEADIMAALRPVIDPAFLPRPLIKVDALPRTASGKLPLDRLRELESMAWSG